MYVIIRALGYFVNFLEIMIFIRVIMSWISIDPYSQFASFVYRVTEPVLEPVRELMNKIIRTGPIDFSPIVALLLIQFAHRTLLRLLIGMGL